MTVEPLRVAIVEYSPDVHLALAGLLENTADVRIVRHARSLVELAGTDPSGVDVLIADLRMCINSPAGLKRLRNSYPGLRLIVTTMDGGRQYEEAIARLSPDAWLPKADLGRRLVDTLRGLLPPAALPTK